MPRLAVRHRGPYPQRSGAEKSCAAALQVCFRHENPNRLNETSHSRFNHERTLDLPTESKVLQWLEKRLPSGSVDNSSFVVYPVPRNLIYLWTFGGILAFMLGVQIITGVVLAMHYTPQVDLAFRSVEGIMRDVNFGWLLRYLHANGASMFFFAVYVHM